MSEERTVGIPNSAGGDPPTGELPALGSAMPELSIGPAGGSSAASTAEPPKLDGYVVHSAVGEGGMGTIWRGVQLSTRRNVALKLISAAGFGSERARQRFDREVEITARLEHPNIARVYDSGINRGVYFFAMELIDGVPLDQFVSRQKLPRHQVLRLFVTICRAVHHAHSKGVIHRDLKPGNILVSTDGQPHVLDFGLAKALLQAGKEAGISLDGEVAGTPGYMAPEQAAGKGDLDPRCDVYSLGVILYRLLTGHTPHDLSGTYIDVLRRISEEEPKRPRQADKSMDWELEAVLLHAIERNPKHRYADAGDFAKDIENYLNGDPIAARPPSMTYFLRKRARKHRVKLVTLMVVALLIGSAGLLTWGLNRSRREKVRQETLKLVAIGNEKLSQQKWEEARIVFLEGAQKREQAQLSPVLADLGLWDVNRQSPPALMTIANPANAVVSSGSLVFLPDGRRVLAGYSDGTLRLLDAATGSELRKVSAHSAAIRSVSVGGNGSLALSGAVDGALGLWDLNTGQKKFDIAAPVGTPTKLKRLALSPDGRFALAARGDAIDALDANPHDDVLILYDATNGKVLLSSDRANDILCISGSTTQICFSSDSQRVMAGGADVGVWNVLDGKRVIPSIVKNATAVAFSDDGRWIAAGSSDGSAIALQLDAKDPTSAKFRATGDLVLAIAYDSRHGRIVEGLEGGGLRIIDFDDTERWVHPSTNSANAIAISSDFQAAMIGGDNGLAAYHIGAAAEELELASAGPFADASISNDGRLALVRSENRRSSQAGVRLLDTATGKPLTPRGFPMDRSSAAALSSDGRTIALVIEDELVIWSLDPAKEVRRFPLRTPGVSDPTAIAISFDGLSIALSGRGNTLLLYRMNGASEPVKLSGHAGRITSIAFSGDGRDIITGSEDMTARLWNVETGASIAVLQGHSAIINAVALSGDGKLAVTASGSVTASDNSVREWELPSGKQLARLGEDNTPAMLRSLAISGDGSLIAAGDERDKSPVVLVWDRQTGQTLRTIATRQGAARALAFDQSGQMLLYGADGAVVWNFGYAKNWREMKNAVSQPNSAVLAKWYNYTAEPAWATSLNAGVNALSAMDLVRCQWMLGNLDLAEEKLKSVSAQEAPPFYVKLCAEAIRTERQAK